MTSTTDSGTIPATALDHMRETMAARDAAQAERIVAAGQAVVERFEAERLKIVPAELQKRLRAHAAEHRLAEDADLEARLRRSARQRAYMAEIGVDLVALDRMRADFAEQAGAVAALPGMGDAEVSIVPGEGRALEEGDASLVAYDGNWDPGPAWGSSRPGDFAVWNQESFWAPTINRAGSHIRFRQRETGDNSWAWMSWRNGYMRLFTLPAARPLVVDVDVTCEHSRFFIDTDDEPGGSGCRVELSQSVQVEVYSNWADSVPQETVSGLLASTGTTSTENWQDFEAVPAWSKRKVRVNSQKTYAGGQQVAVFASIMNFANGARLNDTRLTAGVDAAWIIDNITVRPVF
ncbi:hypothetical protein ACGFNU_21785 [Spirillospora sp. NPDC048911]|uniref:hypothetical protein n=1 Tax=Spirillospora sp. NPDC048911 TaxID=3364527 RepID=UPI00370F82CA